MTNSKATYPLSAVRALALYKQGLGRRAAAGSSPSSEEIYSTVNQLGAVQIDTLQMVRRSQYLVVWSRLGTYDPVDFDRLIFNDTERRLFEYWLHAACVIPLSQYRYRLPTMCQHREGNAGWWRDWQNQAENMALMDSVLEHVKNNGPVRAADFENPVPNKGSWWDWKPAKRALEHLYSCGDLMISSRVNFQRVYDLRERVLPDWVDTTEPTLEEVTTHLLENSMRALGICQLSQVADYTHMKRTEVKPFLEQLIADGTFATVEADLSDGKTRTLAVHRDDEAIMEEAADGALIPRRTTFLSPFDNLFWARGRDMQLWGFRQVLECYKPEPQREWGYFCLPILHKDRLVGRFDPKLERQAGVLRLKAIYLDPDVSLDEEMVADVARAMRDFMAFHDARDLIIERGHPSEFSDKLLAAL